MNYLGTLVLAGLAVVAPLAPAAQAQEHPRQTEHPKQAEHPGKKAEHPGKQAEHPGKAGDIVAVASAAGSFKTLVAAIEAAGLAETLQGEGPFTVFAPTDEAFAKLPAGTLENLLKPENKDKLAGLLRCHVLPGRLAAADVKTMKATSLGGEELNLQVKDGTVMVGGATVVKADLPARNGVIHAVDAVVLPGVPAQAGGAGEPKDHPAH
ncbi:MAG: fasciclin domain-containing protein [Candidatus Krumholzibacteriia bacterium]